ncbi:hypothetical protein GCM10028815_16510 [Mariniluteicoccus flavus]
MRIGDVERDDAARLLQEHLTAGRLDHEEFSTRMEGALVATHQSQLAGLFSDLPGRRPGELATHAPPLPVVAEKRADWRPWAFAGAAALGVMGLMNWLFHLAHHPAMEAGRHGRRGRGGPEMAPMHDGFHAWPLLWLLVVAGTVAWIVVHRVRQKRRAAH